MSIPDDRLAEIIAAAESPIPLVPPCNTSLSVAILWLMRKYGTSAVLTPELIGMATELRMWREAERNALAELAAAQTEIDGCKEVGCSACRDRRKNGMNKVINLFLAVRREVAGE